MKFKTNIQCASCVAKVTPALDESVGVGNWKVDLSNLQRTLTIDNPKVTPEMIQSALTAVGYQAAEIAG